MAKNTPSSPIRIDRVALRIELARQGLTQTELALRMGVAPSTLGSWLRNVAPAPAGLPEEVAGVLNCSVRALEKAT